MKVLTADHVSRDRRQQQTANSTHCRYKNRCAVCPEDPFRRLEDNIVRFRGELSRQQTESVEADPLLRRKGTGNKKQERDQADHGDDRHDRITDHIEYFG